MKNYLLGLVVVSAFLLGGCASNKGMTELTQVTGNPEQITIVRDTETRDSVQPVLEQWFTDNNYQYNVVQSIAEAKDTDNVFTYRAWWGWDLALYMSKVEMKVTNNNVPVGIAKFDALQYGGFGKFGNAETRLKIIMDVLFSKITEQEANTLLGK